MPSSYDVVVIGAGTGGYVAATRCAQLGFERTSMCQDGDVHIELIARQSRGQQHKLLFRTAADERRNDEQDADHGISDWRRAIKGNRMRTVWRIRSDMPRRLTPAQANDSNSDR